MLETLFLLLTAASWLYWLVAWWLVRSFFRAPPEVAPSFRPPVSILKPVKGLDAQAYWNFASFCLQDYPEFELLFGVCDPEDPAIPVIKQLQQDFSEQDIRLIVAPTVGANPKVSLLRDLSTQARYEVLAISDSDTRVTPDYLRRVVSPLAEEHIGLVTCPYRGNAPLSRAARLEALHMGVTFLPSVVVAWRLIRLDFAMGATAVLRRYDLARIGGFASLVDWLADDYQLGARVAGLGLRVCLSDYVVSCILGTTTFRQEWQREVRWARCTRVSRPWEYPGLLLTLTTPLGLTLLLISGFAAIGWQALAVSLVLRWLVAWSVAGHSGAQETRRWLVWLPVRDVLSALVWFAGAAGRSVAWRGERFILERDGQMRPMPPAQDARWNRGAAADSERRR